MNLKNHSQIFIHQVFEVFEFFGFETRNKYAILDKNGLKIGFAAEQGKGFFGFFFRQFLGHWRTFYIHFFDIHRQKTLNAYHPFRFYFERLEISDAQGSHLGALQKRFSILSKKFDLEGADGQVKMQMRSPIWKIWTFPFYEQGKEVALIKKKWTGIFSEVFTDKDKFSIEFKNQELDESTKSVLLAASVYIDLRYFEKKAK
jgi:uncharacterized protein YxjI